VMVLVRSFTCPNLVRPSVGSGLPSYRCVPCLFGPSMPTALAIRAMARSSIPMETLECLADPARVHVRVVELPLHEDGMW